MMKANLGKLTLVVLAFLFPYSTGAVASNTKGLYDEKDCPIEVQVGYPPVTVKLPDTYTCAARRRIREQSKKTSEGMHKILGGVRLHMQGSDLFSQGKYSQAAEKYREAIAFEESRGNDIHSIQMYKHSLGLSLYSDGKIAEARIVLRESIGKEPHFRSSVAHQILGVISHKEGLFEEAVNESKAAIAIDPLNATAHHNVASSLMALGQIDEAIYFLERGIRLAPSWNAMKQKMAEAQGMLAARNLSGKQAKLFPIFDSVVKVRSGNNSGTGWILTNSDNETLILTVCHVVTDSPRDCTDQISDSLKVEFFDIQEGDSGNLVLDATIHSITPPTASLDLAVLKVANVPSFYKALPITLAEPSQLLPVTIIGHPSNGGDWSPVSGEIKQVFDNSTLVLDATVSSGASGSPVLNNENEIVGVVLGITNDSGISSTRPFVIAYDSRSITSQLLVWGVPFN